MTTVQRIIFLIVFSLHLFLLPGCTETQGQVGVVAQSESVARPGLQQPKQQDAQELIAKRFQEPTLQGRTAVESAIELSEKYAQISEDAVILRERNNSLAGENDKLKEQIDILDGNLKKAEKELGEANNLLVEMRIELNNWKTDVLGFRSEIRQAETAQLEALLKILKVLGGQVASESAQRDNQSSDAALSAKAN
jgi:chromosome segregation ATPase